MSIYKKIECKLPAREKAAIFYSLIDSCDEFRCHELDNVRVIDLTFLKSDSSLFLDLTVREYANLAGEIFDLNNLVIVNLRGIKYRNSIFENVNVMITVPGLGGGTYMRFVVETLHRVAITNIVFDCDLLLAEGKHDSKLIFILGEYYTRALRVRKRMSRLVTLNLKRALDTRLVELLHLWLGKARAERLLAGICRELEEEEKLLAERIERDYIRRILREM